MSSGLARSARAVKPTRSTNRTDTSFRSSRARGFASRAPQLLQNRAPAGFPARQLGQSIVAPTEPSVVVIRRSLARPAGVAKSGRSGRGTARLQSLDSFDTNA